MHLSIKTKIAFASVSIIALVSAFIWNLMRAQEDLTQRMQEMILNNMAAMRVAEQIKYNFALYDNLVFRHLATKNPRLLVDKTNARENVMQWLQQMKSLAQTQTEKDLLIQIQEEMSGYEGENKALITTYSAKPLESKQGMFGKLKTAISGPAKGTTEEQLRSQRREQNISTISREGQTRLNTIYNLCDKLVDIARVKLEESEKSMEETLLTTRMSALTSGAAVVLAVSIVGFILSFNISKPLQNLLQGVRKVTSGQLNVELTVESGDEIGHLTHEFNTMIAKLKENQERLITETITDPLTGLYNLRYFQNQIKNEITRSHRYKHNFMLLILDIDHFKQFNDKNGHPLGNVLLKQIANLLKEALRQDSLVARYGGEEFVIILSETPLDGGKAVAERLRKQIEQAVFPGQDNMPGKRITISIGGAAFPKDASMAEQLIEKADKALYAAKSDGRNCVRWS